LEELNQGLPKNSKGISQWNLPFWDSDINPIDGKSDTITVQDGNITTLDGGAYKSETPTYTIGDFIWEDSNKNGVQDGGQDGLQNITLHSIDGDNNKLGSTQTDENGIHVSVRK